MMRRRRIPGRLTGIGLRELGEQCRAVRRAVDVFFVDVAERQRKLQRQREERQCSAKPAMGPKPTHVRTSNLLKVNASRLRVTWRQDCVSETSTGTFSGPVFALPQGPGDHAKNLSGHLDAGARLR